ncbi:MAG: hypothetical protein P4M09_02395, partial [Devosia sp.]|nr:hypothetical protein [Devosia sp.]
ALGIARRMREEDPAAAATSIARCIRRALSPHYRNLPQLSHIASRILPDWERQGALSARAREPAVSPAR